MASTSANPGSVNEINNKLDNTVRVFDSFYRYEKSVPSQEYDVVNSYFLTVFSSKSAANNFSTTLFRISDETGVPVLTLLDELKNQDTIQLTNTLSYYLNGLRSSSTLVGIYNSTVPNFYAARNVLI